MNVPKSIFRQYDVRGLVDRELTPEFARALGRAFASVAHERLGRAPVIAVGRDNRPSGDSLSRGVRRGITEAGGTAIDVGTLPTPALYFAVSAPGTGCRAAGHRLAQPARVQRLQDGAGRRGLSRRRHPRPVGDHHGRALALGAGKETSDGSVLQRYREGIISRHQLERPVRVVVDCGNGVGSLIAVSTLRGLGAEVTPLFCESDGSFPNHHPDPTVPENLRDLQAAVRRTGAELGIAFDGDADRIGAVDETGEIIYGDQLLVIFGRDAVERFGRGTPVIFDVKCSEVLPAALTAAGAKPVMWKTGHSLIKAKMKELKAPLAGEMSGHMFFGGDYLGFDDALFAAARLLEIVSRRPFGLATHLADLPRTFATPRSGWNAPRRRSSAWSSAPPAHFASRYPVNTIDGVRITFPKGWGLLRASNTQPVLVMRFEATDAAGARCLPGRGRRLS